MSDVANSEIELELTFLAKFWPKELDGVEPVLMKDIYVPDTARHPYLRLRQKGDKYEITKKRPVSDSDISTQTEQTIPLQKTEFDALSSASQKAVSKKRYHVQLAGREAEVDVFTDKLAGLVLIDFEFKTQAEKTAFKPPDCCLADVTQEEFIAGGLLAGKSFTDIKDDLAKFDYQPLTRS